MMKIKKKFTEFKKAINVCHLLLFYWISVSYIQSKLLNTKIKWLLMIAAA